MSSPKIAAHTIIKNEENWIWYSIMSVIDYVDEILVWDTGSTDKTVEIVKSIFSPKIKFKQIDTVDQDSFTVIRQQMLDQTKSDWLMILDGDEIWPNDSIKKTTNFIRSQDANDMEYFIHPYHDLLGDVFHYQEPSGGKYKIDKYQGHITIRFMNLNLLPKLHFGKPHGQQGIFDENETLIQNREPQKYKFMKDNYYLHATHLHRSSADHGVIKRSFKFKYEWGLTFPNNFQYPLSFYLPHNNIVPNPSDQAGADFWLNALWQTPLKYIKRRAMHSASGY